MKKKQEERVYDQLEKELKPLLELADSDIEAMDVDRVVNKPIQNPEIVPSIE